MKYIICEDFSGQPVPFIFPDRVAHLDMREQLPYAKVIAAGYITLVEGRFICSGGDADLGAVSRPQDAKEITDLFFQQERQ